VIFNITRKRLAEEILPGDLPPLVRLDRFQLICNVQETWHISTLQFQMEKIRTFQKYRGTAPSEVMPVRQLMSV
jgi:hypothetical protein